MFLLQQLLPGMLIALLLSGVFAIAGRLWRVNGWADAVALAVGYAGGHAATAGWPAFPPLEATQWLPYFALATMFLAVLDVSLRPTGVVRAVVWVLFCAGLLRLLLQAKFQYGWSFSEGLFWIAVFAAGMLVLASFLDAAVRRDSSISSSLVLTIMACATGATLMLSGSMLLGQLGMVLVAALGAIVVVSFLFPRAVGSRGIVPVTVALFTSLWLSGCFYADLPLASALLLAAGSLPALLLISLSEKVPSWNDLLLRASLVIIPSAISLFLAIRASPPLEY
jgi:hypothetical protein